MAGLAVRVRVPPTARRRYLRIVFFLTLFPISITHTQTLRLPITSRKGWHSRCNGNSGPDREWVHISEVHFSNMCPFSVRRCTPKTYYATLFVYIVIASSKVLVNKFSNNPNQQIIQLLHLILSNGRFNMITADSGMVC